MDFPCTQWSLLAQASLHGDSSAAAALAQFCERYRAPIIQFMLQRGVVTSEVEDLAHDFLLHVMEKSTLHRADAARGRFRFFLMGALVRYLHDVVVRRQAQKRGGGAAPLSLDAGDELPGLASVAAPDAALFDQQWARGMLTLALHALEADYAARGRSAEFAVLRGYIPGTVESPPYETAAAQLGGSIAALKSDVHRLRQRFRALLREQIAATVMSPDEIDPEMAYLARALRVAP